MDPHDGETRLYIIGIIQFVVLVLLAMVILGQCGAFGLKLVYAQTPRPVGGYITSTCKTPQGALIYRAGEECLAGEQYLGGTIYNIIAVGTVLPTPFTPTPTRTP